MRVHFCYGLGDTMTNKTVYTVELQDNGSIKAKTADAKQFNNEMGKSAGISKAVKASYQSYDQARGAGGTGAAGRDFAKQAEGLGGLVRVYATFAANIFAVSAAFNALSNAADTSNLVKGLDQLGAASGKNLGTLAKRITEVTDGAVSMREAMTATSQATAAGMASGDILKMAKGAKQASQALGIDMPDALSRLSRGISKIEPELLDELGIFVRVDKASQDYAKSIGKSVGALTDVEKRAAFAKAVLDQLDKKFSGIDIPANPYSQVLASLKNVAQSGLELVNKVLGPIVMLLAQSPTALAVALAGITGILVKQAVPALGAWRANLATLATESKATSERINTQFAEYQVQQSEKHGDEIAKRIQVEKDAAARSLGIAKDSTKIAGLTKGKVFDITQNVPKTAADQAAAFKLLDTQILSNTTRSKNLLDVDAKASKAASDRVVALQALKAELPSLIKLELDLANARAAAEASMHAKPTIGGEAWQREKIAKDASIRAAKAGVMGNVAANTQVMGIAGAWSESKADIAKAGLKGLDAGVTKVRAGFAIATSAVGTFASALSGWLMVGGLVLTGLTMLVSALRSNAEKAAETTAAITALDDASKGAARTFEYWSKQDPLERLSAAGIAAKSNAIEEISSSVKLAMDKAEAEISGRNWMDSTVNWFAKLIGKDTESELALSIANGVVNAIKLAGTIPGTENAIKNLQISTGSSSTNVEGIARSLRNLPAEGLKNVVTQTEKLGKVAKDTSADVTSLKNSYDDIIKKIQEYTLATSKLDTMGEIGQGTVSAAFSLSKALQNPISSIGELNNLLKDSSKLSLFPGDTMQKLVSLAPAFNDTATAIAGNIAQASAYNTELVDLGVQYDKQIANMARIDPTGTAKGSMITMQQKVRDDLKLQISTLRGNISDLNNANVNLVKGSSNTFSALKDATIAQFTAGANIVQKSIAAGFAQASIVVSKAYGSLLSGTVGGEQIAARASKAEIRMQADLILVQVDLIKATIQSAIAIDENTLVIREKMIADAPKNTEAGGGRGSGSYNDYLQQGISETRQSIANKKLLLGKDPYGTVTAAAKSALASGDTKGFEDMKGLVGQAASLSQLSAKVTAILAGSKAVDIGVQGQQLDRALKDSDKITDNKILQLGTDKKLIEAQKASNNISQQEAAVRLNIIDEKEKELNLGKELAAFENIKSKAALVPAGVDRPAALATIAEANRNIDEIIGRVNLAAATTIPLAAAEEAKAARADMSKLADMRIQIDTDTKNRALDLRATSNTAATEALENQNSLNKLTVDSYTQQKAVLELDKLGIEYAKSTLAVQTASEAKLLQISREKAEALALGPTQENVFKERTIAEDTAAKQLLDTLRLGYEARVKGVEVMSVGTERMTAFNLSFESSVASMSDALVDFAMTGKQSFGDMVQSMILDMVKLDMRMKMSEALKGANGLSGIASMIGKAIGFSSGTVGPEQLSGPVESAKGNAFDSGIQKFAKGGSFTNSIVNSPTLFKFAQGTGLMGEAGAEAIMPLKRDAQGNLGVRGGQGGGGEVSVVVNNFSTANATTKETKDSRGNRRIEVTVGDMVAGEINRVGSGIQQSLKGTFGSQPQLIRR